MTDLILPDPAWLTSDSDARVYWCAPDELLADGREEKFMAWLNEEERARHTRFVFPHSKREFLAGRALIRGLLGLILNRPPESLDFTFNADGKPALKGIETTLHFNLTHTRDLVALALHPSLVLGVDAEVIDPDRADPGLAKRFFSVHETRHLWKFEDAAYAEEFFRIWTMKEAYIKALGTGMQTPLDRFWILPSESDPAKNEIGFAPDANDVSEHWQITCMRPTIQHHLAVAISSPDRRAVPVSISRLGCL